MPNPLTHLLWGYVVARAISPRPRYLALGMLMGVGLDVDAVLPGFDHHGWMHTPVFAAFVSITLWGASRDRTVLLATFAVVSSHLALDSVATPGGVMWLWPFSTEAVAIWPLEHDTAVVAVRTFLLLAPLYWMWNTYRRTGESPLAAVEWASGLVPRPVTWGGLSAFGLAAVLVMGHRYLAMVVG